MTSWMRWGDWVTINAGLALLVVPFAADQALRATSIAACLLGALVMAVGLRAASAPAPDRAEWVGLVVGAAVFAAPWILGLTAATALAWSCWTLGPLIMLSSGWEVARSPRRLGTSA